MEKFTACMKPSIIANSSAGSRSVFMSRGRVEAREEIVSSRRGFQLKGKRFRLTKPFETLCRTSLKDDNRVTVLSFSWPGSVASLLRAEIDNQ